MELATPPASEFGLTPPGGGRGGRQGGAPGGGRGQAGATPFNRNDFFRAEGALGTLSTAARGHGIYTIGGNRASDPATTLTAVVIPAEQYGRMARMLAKNLPVTIEADIKNTYNPNPMMFNVVGEIPGTDKADELVMLGAHFDSWHASTGATDNAAGSAAMLEAMRILKQSGLRLRRTVRIGLWTGEEQGLIGSAQYVSAPISPHAVLLRRRLRLPSLPTRSRDSAAGVVVVVVGVDRSARSSSSPIMRSSPVTSTSIMERAQSAESISRGTMPWRRFSANGSSHSAVSACRT